MGESEQFGPATWREHGMPGGPDGTKKIKTTKPTGIMPDRFDPGNPEPVWRETPFPGGGGENGK